MVRLHAHVYDSNINQDDIQIRIRNTTTGAPVAIPLACCNPTQQFVLDEKGVHPMTFEWYIQGHVGGYWSAGDDVTLGFEVNTFNAPVGPPPLVGNVRFIAGEDTATYPEKCGPMVIEVIAPPTDINVITPATP